MDQLFAKQMSNVKAVVTHVGRILDQVESNLPVVCELTLSLMALIKPSNSMMSQISDRFDGFKKDDRQHVVGLGFVFPKSLKEPENFIGQDI